MMWTRMKTSLNRISACLCLGLQSWWNWTWVLRRLLNATNKLPWTAVHPLPRVTCWSHIWAGSAATCLCVLWTAGGTWTHDKIIPWVTSTVCLKIEDCPSSFKKCCLWKVDSQICTAVSYAPTKEWLIDLQQWSYKVRVHIYSCSWLIKLVYRRKKKSSHFIKLEQTHIFKVAGKMSMEYVTSFLSKYICKADIDAKRSPYVNNTRNPHMQRNQTIDIRKLCIIM